MFFLKDAKGAHNGCIGNRNRTLELSMSRLMKIGNHEFHVVVQASGGGGFTYTVVDIDLTGPQITEIRYESHLCFETENDAYEGGSAHVRKRARTGAAHR
ncbi:hypothetical protein AWB83_04945 [Caballeronia ptereochthonis]|uniref:Uncharacterized protein n=1 Tax=Caballeronia ptereochthonis TaxID=1777144 RepID=A0A158D1E5_9BURK|nr:hypothetical protein AWB83_04945 [Caballeronia ptereochthonis]